MDPRKNTSTRLKTLDPDALLLDEYFDDDPVLDELHQSPEWQEQEEKDNV